MEREEVINIYNDLLCGKRDQISFSKGYEIFEFYYQLFKKYGLKRREIKNSTWTEIVVYVDR